MTFVFTFLIIMDGWLEQFVVYGDKTVKGTLSCVLIVFLVIFAQLELSKLAALGQIRIFTFISSIASVLFATGWYWLQIFNIPASVYFCLISGFSLLGLLLCQYLIAGTSGVLINCGASCFSIFYLGLLSAFCLAIRIDLGVRFFLMFIFVVKSADIGAYTIGKLCGTHRFAPKISPGKTWEGMAGAIVTAVIVAIGFALSFDIMVWWLAVIFGFCFAFIGQFGDLAESMIKRDVKSKDSADMIPGFGGILDIIDSPVAAALFAYLFFMFSS